MTTALPSADHRSAEGEPSDTANGLATSELAIGGMHCASCAQRVQRSLRAVPAVASVAVNLATERAYVTFDPAVGSTDQLCEAVAAGGYSAEPAPEELSVADEAIDREGWRWRAVASWPLALAALGVSLVAPENATSGWIVLLLAVVVEIVGGWPFLRSSARLLRHGATSMDTLITLGHAGRPGGERRGGDRPGRPTPPPRRQRRLRGSAPRRHGAADHRHPRDRPRHRGAGAGPGGPGPSLVARSAAPDGAPGRRRRGRRDRPDRGARSGPGRGPGARPLRRDDPARRRGRPRLVGGRRVDADRRADARRARPGEPRHRRARATAPVSSSSRCGRWRPSPSSPGSSASSIRP